MDEIPQELTAIWSCAKDKCNGWMRDNFVFATQPICAQCGSFMEKSEKMLPVLANTSPNQAKRR